MGYIISSIHKLKLYYNTCKSICTYFNPPFSLSSEVPLVLYLFLLISLVWLWAGLHMGYKQLWMLILYVIFNCLLVSS